MATDTALQNIRFNRDGDCFVACSRMGVWVFNTSPLVDRLFLDSDTIGPIISCDLLNRSNLLALVHFTGPVYMWDCAKRQTAFVISNKQPAISVRLSKSFLVVVTLTRLYIYPLLPINSTPLAVLDTRSNPMGLAELSDSSTLVYPGAPSPGSFQVNDLLQYVEGNSSRCPITVSAHRTELVCLAMNRSGSLIATASQTGTIIRIFSGIESSRSSSGGFLCELRRGSDPATLSSLSLTSTFLCAASDKGTVHIYALHDKGRPHGLKWSLAQFSVPSEKKCIAAFVGGRSSSVMALCDDGAVYKYSINTDTGSAQRELYDNFLEIGLDNNF